MGAVNGDFNRRRGQIEKMEPRPGNVSGGYGVRAAFGNVRLHDRSSFVDAGTRDFDDAL